MMPALFLTSTETQLMMTLSVCSQDRFVIQTGFTSQGKKFDVNL